MLGKKQIASHFKGRRLLWNILFFGGHLGLFIFGWLKQAQDARLAGLNTLRHSVWISRGAGLCLGVDGLLLILPVLRNLIRVLRPICADSVPLDENVWFHRQIAYSVLFWSIVHTTAHYVNMFNVERTQIRKEMAWAIMYTQPGGFTGHIMLLIMFLMYTTAHQRIRKQSYEAFWYTHHLALFWLLGLYTHATGCFVRGALPGQPVKCLGYNSWMWTIWAGIAYFAERIVRAVRARRKTDLIGVLLHPSGVVELRFVKPSLRYKAGQWIYLNVPAVSAWQWHPFTISSAPDDPYVSVHCRQVGDWTTSLARILGCTSDIYTSTSSSDFDKRVTSDNTELNYVDIGTGLLSSGRSPVLHINGPFGSPAEDVFNYEAAVLVAAGIGVTPFAAILKNIWYRQQQGKLGMLRRVHFIWTTREMGSFEWFRKLLYKLEQIQTDRSFLSINMYLTQHVDKDTMANITILDCAAKDVDPVTRLRSKTHFGRPDFDFIMNSLATQIETGSYLPGSESTLSSKVGVFYCGPNPLAKTLKDVCKKASTKQVRFAFRKEHF